MSRRSSRVGNTVYIGGSFTQVMSSGGGQVANRNHAAAFNATSGAVLPWNPNPDGIVRAIASADNGSIFALGGDFTHVGGSTHNHIAEVGAAGSGAVKSWPGSANGTVRSIKAAHQRFYFGGDFTSAGGAARAHLAALGVVAGKIQPWVPKANALVRAVALSPKGNRIFVGGDFTTINGHATPHLMSVTATNGSVTAFRDHPGGQVNQIQVSTERVFEGDSGGGGHVAAYNVNSGHHLWTNTTDGNVEGLAQFGNFLVVGGHFNVAGAFTRHHLASVNKKTGRVDPTWAPSANSALGVFSEWVTGTTLYVGGDFTAWSPGNVQQAHFARFTP